MNEAARRLAALGVGLSVLAACAQSTAKSGAAPWVSEFDTAPSNMTSVGRNPYFVLEPGHYVVLRDHAGNQVTATVLDETKMVDGVETRVLEERELEAGHLIEVSRNFFAIHKPSQNAMYFGEEVDMYRDGKVVSHEGSWLAGVNGAKAGMIMPGDAHAGYRHYQEQAPGVAMDRAEILSTKETLKTPAGKLEKCAKVAETNALKSGELEYKYYAPGIGLVKEEQMLLVEHGTRHQDGGAIGK
jgi:hypothetical protein